MYETLLTEAEKDSVEVVEIPFLCMQGLYCDRVIGIKKGMTTAEKACILAEELGHYHTSVGDILDQHKPINRKLENRARRWGYEKLVPLEKFISAFEAGVQNRLDLTEYLDVTEKFLLAVLKHYQEKHGKYRRVGNYIIVFEPLIVFREICAF